MSSAYNHVPRAKVAATRLLVAFLTVIDSIHRCSGPLSGFFAREARLVLYAGFFIINCITRTLAFYCHSYHTFVRV